jgi:FtsH-binding integral membrane protein
MPDWKSRRIKDERYLVTTVLAALTGLTVAVANDGWWPGWVLMAVALGLFFWTAVTIRAQRRRDRS